MSIMEGISKPNDLVRALAAFLQAALWLWQLLGSDADAREEACKAKAAEVHAQQQKYIGTNAGCCVKHLMQGPASH